MTDFKRGDSFDQIVPISEAFSEGSFKTGFTITAQIRTKKYNKLISDLSCTFLDPDTTRYLRLMQMNTSTWPLGEAVVDVQFVITDTGYTFSSESIPFTIIQDVTSESV